MVIHCKTAEEAKSFIHFLHEKGFKWNGGKNLLSNNHFLDFHEGTCYKVYEDEYLTVGSLGWFADRNETVTEFSDLIIPELSAKGVLETMREISNKFCCEGCSKCPFDSKCDHTEDCIEDIIEVCTKWREEHPKEEKKELETEWVYVVRVIKVENNGFKKCVYEEDFPALIEKPVVEDVLKHYCSEHDGNFFATLEHICRMKE